MTQDTKIFDGIRQLLIQQKVNMHKMQDLLTLELEAVKKRNGNDLRAVSEEKEKLLTVVTQLDQQLSSEAQLEFIKAKPELQDLQKEITSLLNDCQHKNEVVYLTATQNQVAIDDVKRLLIGGSKNTTYDAYGKKQSGGSLGKGIKA